LSLQAGALIEFTTATAISRCEIEGADGGRGRHGIGRVSAQSLVTEEAQGEGKQKPSDGALDPGPQAKLTPSQAYFDKCEEKLGIVPNVLRAYAFDNAKLQAFIDMVDDLMLADSGLTKLEREMIAVAVSAINHCHYCLTAHGAAVRQRSKDPVMGEVIAQNWRAANLSAKQHAMMEFVEN
jgi:AhpD family alkylhydroperoxidase